MNSSNFGLTIKNLLPQKTATVPRLSSAILLNFFVPILKYDAASLMVSIYLSLIGSCLVKPPFCSIVAVFTLSAPFCPVGGGLISTAFCSGNGAGVSRTKVRIQTGD